LPSEWGDAVGVGDVDRENSFFISSKTGSSHNQFGRDDVRVLVVHRLECREVEVGRWVARGDVEMWGVVIALGCDSAVGGCLSL